MILFVCIYIYIYTCPVAVYEPSTIPVAVQEGKSFLTCVLFLQSSCLFLLIVSRHAGSGGSQVGRWGSSGAIEEHDAEMILKYKGPRTVDKMEQTDIAGRRSFSSGNGRRNYIELRTAVGEAGVERGLASGGAPCCGRFHAATAHRYDCSVHTERQYFARISNSVVKCIS